MELILKKDNKTLEFVSGSQEINVNDDLVQIISVMPEMPLAATETLCVAFEQNGTVAHTLPLFGDEGRYTTNIPQAMIDLGGEWEFQILRRRYATSEHEGGFIQTASNKGAFTIGEGVKTVDGTVITTAMLTTLYREVLEDKEVIKEQVADATTQAETAAEHAESAAASASTAQGNAAIAGSYATAAEVSAQSILPKLDAAETAAASASESAAVAMASAEKAEGAAVAAESAADAAVEKVSDLEKDVALLNTALMQGGIIYKADTETAYNERITAGGLNVLDGSKAVLKKVVGSTVKCNNLIPFPYVIASGTTKNGVTLTYDEYGVISLAGKNESNEFVAFNLTDDVGKSMKLKAGTYKYSQNVSYDMCTMTIGVRNPSGGFVTNLSSINAENKTIITIPQEYEDNDYQYHFTFSIRPNVDVNGVVVKLMFNEGETALPYQPYFTGLKTASFAGIESTGRNLFKEPENYTNGLLQVDGSIDAANANYRTTDYMAIQGGLKYTISFDQTYAISSGATSFRGVIYDKDKTVLSHFTVTPAAIDRYSYTFTAPKEARYYRIGTRITDKNIMLNAGSTALPYEPYFEPTVFNFPKTELGEWDSIDFEKQKVVKATETIVLNGTENWEFLNSYISLRNVPSIANANNGICNLYPYLYQFAGKCIFVAGSYLRVGTALGETFNNDVAKWKAHLAELYASGNPLVIAYELATPTETQFTDGNKYKAWANGTERVLGNDNAEYGATNTLSQNYIVVKE